MCQFVMPTRHLLELKMQLKEKLRNVWHARNQVSVSKIYVAERIWCQKFNKVNYFFDFPYTKNVDGTSPGDGTTIGKCPSQYSTYRCLSTGECNECGLISGFAEGCDILSSIPVCDTSYTTFSVADSKFVTVSKCVACKTSG